MNIIKTSLLMSSIIFANAYACDNFNFTLHNLTGTNCKLTYKASSLVESNPLPQILEKNQTATTNLTNNFPGQVSIFFATYSCENNKNYQISIKGINIPQKWCAFGTDFNLEK